jgi:hypothetical protein
VEPPRSAGGTALLEDEVQDPEEIRVDVSDVHGRDDKYHETSLVMQ